MRNRLNGKYSLATEEWGGKIDYQGFVHTFNGLVPPEEHFATHPEYFSEIDGQRVGERSQLCLTNPDVLRVATETVYRWIAENPAASIISVSQNDWHNYCQCANCSALAEKEGSQSGPLLHFVNGIAAPRGKTSGYYHRYPAYQYQAEGPRTVKLYRTSRSALQHRVRIQTGCCRIAVQRNLCFDIKTGTASATAFISGIT